jgi:16S rRNA (uracil1498-N3)-methyltransferase
MSDRYYVDQPIASDSATLTGPEAHHLIHVMRAAPGVQVVLFDGSGAEFPAVVERVRRSEVDLSILSRIEAVRELPFELTLGVALPKGDRQKWLVEKTVELGVTRLVPLQTHRAVAQPTEQAIARLRRSVVEASKQCGRNRLMQIAEPSDWPNFLQDAADVPCRLLAHPATGQACPPHAGEKTVLAVGPEGGFTDDEASLAIASGWRPVDLGPRILRVETAALAMAAIVATSR